MFFPIRSRSGSVLLVVLFISTIALVTFASFHDTVSSLLRIRAISGGAWHMVVSDTLRLLRSDIPSRSLVGGSIVEYSHTSSGSVLYVYSGSTTDIPLRAPGTVNITLLAGAPVRYIQTE